MVRLQISLWTALVVALTVVSPGPLKAQERIEKSGVAVGVTAGNLWFLPIKAITMTVGAISGALSYVVTGGNRELTEQIWQDTSQGPYLITPELARDSIGYRPEPQQTK